MSVEQNLPRLAVLIDADNVQATIADRLLEEIATHGTATVRRVYGDWTSTNLKGWKEHLHTHAIQPIQQFSYTTGKNSTDSSLIIDAMDLLYMGNFDGFCLVSSDSDLTRLATRLREAGKSVLGFGRKDTPAAFVAACDRFTFIEALCKPARGSSPLAATLTTVIKTVSNGGEWVPLSALGLALRQADKSFEPKRHGFATLGKLVKAQDYLAVRGAPDGQLDVRLKTA